MSQCPCRFPCSEVECNSLLMSVGESFRFEKGVPLWNAGDSADWVGSICVGMVKVVADGDASSGTVISLSGRGSLLGLEASVPDRKRPATVVPLVSGRGMRASTATIRRHLGLDKLSPGVSVLLGNLASEVERSSVRVGELTQGSVGQRLARVLTRMAFSHGLRDARGLFLPVPLSRAELARLVTCREETVIRLMRRWEQDGVLSTQREGMVVHDIDALVGVNRAQASSS